MAIYTDRTSQDNNNQKGKYRSIAMCAIVAVVIFLAILGLAGCQDRVNKVTNTTTTSISSDFFEIDEENLIMSATVGNSCNAVSLLDLIEIPEDATMSFADGTYSFADDNMSVILKVGENIFYVKIKQETKEREYQIKIYRKHIYEVRFDAQNSTPVVTRKVEEGDFITPPDVSKLGYKFLKWDVDISQPITESFTTRAVWVQSEYTLAIDANGGECEVEEVRAVFNDSVNLPKPTRIGYIFTSWRIKSTNEIFYDGGKWVIAHDDTLVAQWTIKFYTIYVGTELIGAENGDGAGNIKGTGNYRLNDECTLEIQPNKGYEYVGLFDGDNCLTTENKYSFVITNSNVALVAKFNVKVPQMKEFYFTTENEKDDYVITGLRSTNITVISVPECVVGIKQGAFADVVHKVVSYTAPFTGGSATENSFLTYVFGASADNINDAHYIPEKLSFAHITKIIGDHAFDGFTSIAACTIGKDVTKIGDYAFYGCAELKKLSGEEYATEIGEYAFAGCRSLTTASLNADLTEIKAHTFENTALTSISLPKKVTKIGDYAFNGCNNLSDLSGEEYVTEIGKYAFANCIMIRSFTFNDNITEIKEHTFDNNRVLATIDWPENLTTIGDSAFGHCIKIETVSLPSVQNIGDYAFSSCISVNSVSFGNNLKDIGAAAFLDTKIKTVTIPASVEKIGQDVFRSCDYLGEVNFAQDGNLKGIGSRAFSSTAITSVDIPASVENIYANAFGNCKKLATVNFVPNGNLKKIDKMAFAGCPIKEFIVPDTVEFLGMQILSYNDNEVIEVLSVPFVGTNRKKDNCQPLEYFFFNEIAATYSNKYVPKSLKEVSITDAEYLYLYNNNSISNIGTTSVFYNCTSITDIYIAPTLKETPINVFSGCTSLATLACPVMQDRFSDLFNKVVPESLTKVTLLYGENSKAVPKLYFQNCNDIEKVVLQGNFTSIGFGAFNNCTELREITIPQSVVSIEMDAFNNCTELREITIPQSVVSIEMDAFLNCSELDNITFEDTQNWEYFDEDNEKYFPIDVTDRTTVIYILIKKGCEFWKNQE